MLLVNQFIAQIERGEPSLQGLDDILDNQQLGDAELHLIDILFDVYEQSMSGDKRFIPITKDNFCVRSNKRKRI